MRIYICGFGGLTNINSEVSIALEEIHFLERGTPANAILGNRHAAIAFEQTIAKWALATDEASAHEVILGPRIYLPPAGSLIETTGRLMQDNILESIEREGRLDAVLVHLPGTTFDLRMRDITGVMIERLREKVAEHVFIGVLAGAHGPLTPPLLACVDAVICSEDNPEAASMATSQLLQIMQSARCRRALPITNMVSCDGWYVHDVEAFESGVSSVIAKARATAGVLAVSVSWASVGPSTHGQHTNVVVVTDDNLDLALQVGGQICAVIMQLCRQYSKNAVSVREAFRLLSNAGHGISLILDMGDDPALGAAGKSTALLQEILSRNIHNVALGPVVSERAVDSCMRAGIGHETTLFLQPSDEGGAPMSLRVVVEAMQQPLVQVSHRREIRCGEAVLVSLKDRPDLHIVIVAERTEAISTHLFSSLGIRLDAKRIIVTKSQMTLAGLAQQAGLRVISVATPGATYVTRQDLHPYRADVVRLAM
jgi:microcystin degradation protein MlrC